MRNAVMPIDPVMPTSVVLAPFAGSLITCRYIHSCWQGDPIANAIEPILCIDAFRYIGPRFLSGVTTEAPDPRVALPGAYGALAAAVFAFIAIGTPLLNSRWALESV